MNENTEELKDDYIPLRDGKVSSLLTKFAVPSIVAMLDGSIYNIVDQYFIGQCVGVSGNAATNIAFPLAMCCTAIALLAGIGGASNFNLSMGRGHKDIAGYYIGNAIIMLAVLGTILGVGTKIYLDRILYAFGSPEDVLPYARTYVGITSIGFPYLILTIGGGHLIRADGSPRIAMACNMSGAVINTVLDYIFVMKLGFGMAGAAWATVTVNTNTLAVATLTDVACIIFAEGSAVDPALIDKAIEEEIPLFSTDLSEFEAAMLAYEA